ncbi:MAG: ferritin-like domain-containing protein [Actinomycetota bacterium]
MDRLSADATASASVNAESQPAPATSRRRLIGAAGLAGLASAATALTSSTVSAAPEDQPNIPTEADTALLAQAMQLELAARDLYRRRLADDVGAGDISEVVSVMAENHEAYAQAIAGATGLSANTRNEAVYDSFVEAFEGGRTQFATAARDLEEAAVATHTALLSEFQSADAVNLTASILVVEARHATVLADLLGVELSDRLANAGAPLQLGGAA